MSDLFNVFKATASIKGKKEKRHPRTKFEGKD